MEQIRDERREEESAVELDQLEEIDRESIRLGEETQRQLILRLRHKVH